MGYLVLSYPISMVIRIPLIIFLNVTKFGGILYISLLTLCVYILMVIFFYIMMYRHGYQRNTKYEGNSAKELYITVGIAIPLFTVITILFMGAYPVYIATLLHISSADADAVVEDIKTFNYNSDYLNYYYMSHLRYLSSFLQSVLYGLVMIFGFNKGYKKREKDRKVITSSKND